MRSYCQVSVGRYLDSHYNHLHYKFVKYLQRNRLADRHVERLLFSSLNMHNLSGIPFGIPADIV